MTDQFNFVPIIYRCEEVLSQGINARNVAQLWVSSDMNNAQKLRQKVIQFLKANGSNRDVRSAIREALKVRSELGNDLLTLLFSISC